MNIMTQTLICTLPDTASSVHTPMHSLLCTVLTCGLNGLHCSQCIIVLYRSSNLKGISEKKIHICVTKKTLLEFLVLKKGYTSVKLFTRTVSHKKDLNEDLLLGLKLFPLKTSNFARMLWILQRIQPYENKYLAKLST